MSANTNLPPGWALATLPELVAGGGFVADGDWVESKDQDPAGEIRLTQLADVGDGDFRDRSRRFLTLERAHKLRCTFLAEGDLMIARMPDPLGRACVFPGSHRKCVTAVDVCIVRAGTSGVNNRWLMHFLNAPPFRTEVARLQSGTTRKRISKKNLCTLQIPVPGREEQDRIAVNLDSCLSRLDEAVAGLERVQRNLKRYRGSVLRAAVDGRLVPTEAELARAEGRDYEPASALLEQVLQHRRQRRGRRKRHDAPDGPASASLPNLPEGWVWTTIEQVADTASGGTPRRDVPSFYGGTIPWVKSGELRDGIVRVVEETITSEAIQNSSAKVFPAGTLCVALYGATVGRLGILGLDAATNQAVCGVFLPPQLRTKFYFWVLYHLREQLVRSGKGGAQPNISQEIVRLTPIPIPPAREQERIVIEIERLFSIADRIESTVTESLGLRAKRLRQAVLGCAFDGNLVEQDPTDEPAAVLLERIRKSRECAGEARPANARGRKGTRT
jgi:type I restriction enzyme S subunit